MAVRKIKILLNTDESSADCGVFKAEAFGYQGKGCDVDLAAFQTLGEVKSFNKKAEYKHVQQGRVTATA